MSNARYVVGDYQQPPQGKATRQERKSPPLAALLPNRDDYLRPSVERYFDPAHAALEWEKLWAKVWLCAGRVADLPVRDPGFRYDIARGSFIIVRASDDRITALYNVCQHRANRLVDGEFGTTNLFVCPYHSWNYRLSGECARVTDRELFHNEALAGDLGLKSARCETHGGFVFISMDPDAPPLADYLGDLADVTSGYQLDRLEIRSDVVLDLDCNWKTILDAFSENYHVHITHQFAMPVTEDKIGQMDFYPGGHSRRIVALGNPSVRRGTPGPLDPMQSMLLAGVGIDPERFDGGAMDVRTAVQRAKRAMNGPAGAAYATLSDNQLTDDWAINIFPNMHWSMHAEGMLMMRYYPHRSDPGRCSLHIMTLAHPGLAFDFYLPEAAEREASGRPKRTRVRHDDPDVKDRIGQLLFEDIRNTRETQQGLQSRAFKSMRLSEHEQPILFQYAMMDRYLTAPSKSD